jgi:hypothetical protein
MLVISRLLAPAIALVRSFARLQRSLPAAVGNRREGHQGHGPIGPNEKISAFAKGVTGKEALGPARM